MRFKTWLTESSFTNLSTSILASFFEGQDDLGVLHDSLLDNGQDEIATLIRYVMECIQGGTGHIVDRKKLIEFNRIFRKLYHSFRGLFKPSRWRVDDNAIQKAGYVAEVRETGAVPTRKGNVKWPYQSVTYLLHKGDVGVMKNVALYHNYTVGRSRPLEIYRQLLEAMQKDGVQVWPLGDTHKVSEGEILTQSLNCFAYHKDLHVSEFPEGMLWRAFLTMMAPYGSKDLIRLMGTAR
jgi:hypothetical protein